MLFIVVSQYKLAKQTGFLSTLYNYLKQKGFEIPTQNEIPESYSELRPGEEAL